MEKLSIFCLSFLVIFSSCVEKSETILDRALGQSLDVRRSLAEEYDSIHSSFYQGSIWSKLKYDTLIKILPEEGKYYREKSIAFSKIGDFHLAVPLLEEAVKKNPRDTYYYTGWLYLSMYRDYPKALNHLERYDAMTPNVRDYAWSQNVNYLKGLCHKQMGDFQKAIEEFSTCIKDEGKLVFDRAFTYRGISHYELKNWSKAIDDFNSSLKIFPEGVIAQFYKGLALQELNRRVDARKSFELARKNLLAGNQHSNYYNEVFNAVHLEMIEEKLQE